MLRPAIWTVAMVCLLAGASRASSLSGTVKDPSGAAVAQASVTAAASASRAVLQTTSDAQGLFRFDNLPAGTYTVTVTHENFARWESPVKVTGERLEIAVSLKLTGVTTSVTVSGRRSPLANSDPNYQALRGGKLNKVYRVENLVFSRDAGTFTFRSGSFSFLPPVLGHVTTGVFVGDGNFKLRPASELAVKHLHRSMGSDSVDEDFTAMVVYFTDATYDEVTRHAEPADESPKRHEDALDRVRKILETRRHPPMRTAQMGGAMGLTFLERILNDEDIPNMEAELLAELYNPLEGGSYRAFLEGRKHSDLRFVVNPRGALPVLSAPEETALLNFEPGSYEDGIWYLSHLAAELAEGRASSREDKRLIAPEHYQMDVVLGKDTILGDSAGLAASCLLRFRALESGVRVVKFELLPDLQMTRVAWKGTDIPFIQEGRKKDGSFYLDMPEPLVKDRTYELTFEYSAGAAVDGAPDRSERGIFDLPRLAWYPRIAGSLTRSTFDLTFHVPHGYRLVTVGKQVRQSQEGASDTVQWVSDVPMELAAFKFLKRSFDKTTGNEGSGTGMGVYVDANAWGALPPSQDQILTDAANAMRVFTGWFGPSSYPNLSVLVGGAIDSLPGLVYISSAGLAGYSSLNMQSVVAGSWGPRISSARGIPPRARVILDEAFATEISRQWWGNTVGPASFHDDWLSRGFANFSASLYDLSAAPDEFREHWDQARETLLHRPRNSSYVSLERPNDAGPLWLGVLNDTAKTPNASNLLSRYKGAFVMHMLRCLMFDPDKGNANFQSMMLDYVKTFANQAATTEDFKRLVEKHITPEMDLEGNHKMDWFFREWVYGTDIPSYRLEYSIAAPKGAKPALTGRLTQSGVSGSFAMVVPIYGEFNGKTFPVGAMEMHGNSTSEFKVDLPGMPKRILLNFNREVLTDKEEVKQSK